ncbi:MAG: tRNA (N6-threonylcarbamoyladenosine(37)-N6)-methyltransferase TrmO [Faecalibacterium sp.]
MKIIARIKTDFPTKFGIPRQSGLVDELQGTIIFEPEYRNPDALRGLEAFSHLWLIWQFSAAVRDTWSPTVRPPRLGGNERMGVFATRSPFRPNPIGLSSVRLLGLEHTAEQGTVIHVAGADLMDGTPIYDIKPYLAYADSHPEAQDGFAAAGVPHKLQVEIAPQYAAALPPDRLDALIGVLASDPRPSYQDDPARVYGLAFAGVDVKFTVADAVVTVCAVTPARG